MSISIGLIGCGRVGAFWLRSALACGLDVDARVRAPETCPVDLQPSLKKIDELRAGEWSKRDLIILAVPEGSWSDVCDTLAPVIGVETVVAHTSGAYGHGALEAAGIESSRCSSIHPLYPFRSAKVSPPSPEVSHGISGSEESLVKCKAVLSAVGSRYFVLHEDKRRLYHLACVLASNHLVTLAAIAQRIGSESTDEQGVFYDALTGLMAASVDNLRAEERPEDALSGPVLRGDVATLGHHIEALSGDPDLVDFYRSLIKHTIPLAPLEHRKGLEDFLSVDES